MNKTLKKTLAILGMYFISSATISIIVILATSAVNGKFIISAGLLLFGFVLMFFAFIILFCILLIAYIFEKAFIKED